MVKQPLALFSKVLEELTDMHLEEIFYPICLDEPMFGRNLSSNSYCLLYCFWEIQPKSSLLNIGIWFLLRVRIPVKTTMTLNKFYQSGLQKLPLLTCCRVYNKDGSCRLLSPEQFCSFLNLKMNIPRSSTPYGDRSWIVWLNRSVFFS